MFDFHFKKEKTSNFKVVHPVEPLHVQELKDKQGSTAAYTYEADGFLWMHWPGLVTFRFTRENNHVLIIEESSLPDVFLEDLFWRNALPFILQAQGWEALHASAVIVPQGVIAFCATSGTGKSTIAFGFHQRGYHLWCDDALVFRNSPDGILVYPVVFNIRLLEDSRMYFNRISRINDESHKLARINETIPVKEPQDLVKVFILENFHEAMTPSVSMVNRCSIADSFRFLLMHAYNFSLFHKRDKKKLISNYLDLVQKIPVFHVKITTGLEDLDYKLDQIEACIKS